MTKEKEGKRGNSQSMKIDIKKKREGISDRYCEKKV